MSGVAPIAAELLPKKKTADEKSRFTPAEMNSLLKFHMPSKNTHVLSSAEEDDDLEEEDEEEEERMVVKKHRKRIEDDDDDDDDELLDDDDDDDDIIDDDDDDDEEEEKVVTKKSRKRPDNDDKHQKAVAEKRAQEDEEEDDTQLTVVSVAAGNAGKAGTLLSVQRIAAKSGKLHHGILLCDADRIFKSDLDLLNEAVDMFSVNDVVPMKVNDALVWALLVETKDDKGATEIVAKELTSKAFKDASRTDLEMRLRNWQNNLFGFTGMTVSNMQRNAKAHPHLKTLINKIQAQLFLTASKKYKLCIINPKDPLYAEAAADMGMDTSDILVPDKPKSKASRKPAVKAPLQKMDTFIRKEVPKKQVVVEERVKRPLENGDNNEPPSKRAKTTMSGPIVTFHVMLPDAGMIVWNVPAKDVEVRRKRLDLAGMVLLDEMAGVYKYQAPEDSCVLKYMTLCL